jgi:hypothetical protein
VENNGPTIEDLNKKIGKLYGAFHILMWDYHYRFHVDEGDNTDYLACVHYPCVNLALDLFREGR